MPVAGLCVLSTRHARLRMLNHYHNGISMKNHSILIIIVLIVVSFSCSVDQKECVCSMEYRGYSIYITDGNHQPIDSLVTMVTDKDSQIIYRTDSSSILDPYHVPGYYSLLTDGEINYFTSFPKLVIFHASNRIYNITESFTFSAGDECRCHILKVSGPDSIIVR
jgi:hypothetical protein